MKYSLAEIELGYNNTLNVFCSDSEYLRKITSKIEKEHPVIETNSYLVNNWLNFKFEMPRGMRSKFPCYAAENYAKLIMLEDGWEPFSIVQTKSGDGFRYSFRKSF